MTCSLEPAAAAFSDALRGLQRTLDESRSQWNDAARQAFDHHHTERIMTAGKKTANQFKDLSAELTAAIRKLDSAG